MRLTFTRETLFGQYRECIAANPLLARMEGELRTIGWTEEEIRTAQLLVACQSNASLKEALEKVDRRIATVHS